MKSYVVVNEKGEALRADFTANMPRAFTHYDQYVGRSTSKAQAEGVLARAYDMGIAGADTAKVKLYDRNDFC